MTDFLMHKFSLAVEDFNVGLLPLSDRTKTGEDLAEAIREFFIREFQHYSGWAEITLAHGKVSIQWGKDTDGPDLLSQVTEQLKAGRYPESIQILQMMVNEHPTNPVLLYNLGMALSDTGKADEAVSYLESACSLSPDDVNARVALGVAHSRSGNNRRAIEELQDAVERDPGNLWAHRNLAACLAQEGQLDRAKEHFLRAVQISGDDQSSLFGLARCYERLGDLKAADDFYHRTLKADEYSEIAQQAKEALTRLAKETFRSKTGGSERMDGVMYCLAALERFEVMAVEEVRKVAFEIAMLGTQGLKVNEPDKKYRLQSLPGEFTGLQLVSYMYVGFKMIAPDQDVGFDLSKEYAAAQALFNTKK